MKKLILSFNNLQEKTFLERINRFVGKTTDGIKFHIRDTGALPLLVKGRKILLKELGAKNRKTQYELIAFKARSWIFSNSGYHSDIFLKTLPFLPFRGKIKKEYKIDNSRIDFKIGKSLVELKGCTWVVKNLCIFPDSRTIRGEKHIRILSNFKDSYIVFLCFGGKGLVFSEPNFFTLIKIFKNRLNFLALKYRFKFEKLFYEGRIPVLFKKF